MQAALSKVVVIDTAKPQSKKSTSKKVVTKDAKVAPLINFLNSVIKGSEYDKRALANTFANACKSFCYKEFKEDLKDKSTVIDINNFKGLSEVRDAYELINKFNETAEKKADASTLTKLIMDPIMRGYMSSAEERYVERVTKSKKSDDKAKKQEESTQEQAQEQTQEQTQEQIAYLKALIATLGLPKPRTTTLADVKAAIDEIMNDRNAFVIKAFNSIFPYSVHDESKEATHINRKYLQHMFAHFDEFLEFVVNNIDNEDLKWEAVKFIFAILVKEFDTAHSKAEDMLLRIQYDTFLDRYAKNHDELIDMITKFVSHKKGVNDDMNDQVIKKLIQDMAVCRKPKKNVYELDATQTLKDIKADDTILELVSTLHKYLAFVDLIMNGKKYTESTSKSVIDYDEIMQKYTTLIGTYDAFIAEHKQDIVNTVEDAIVYLVHAINFCTQYRGVAQTAASFNNDTVTFKLNIKLSRALKDVIGKKSTEVRPLVHKILEESFADTKDNLSIICVVDAIKESPADNANAFARIGDIANTLPNVQINKNTRIGIGLAIVKYVIYRTDLILHREAGKKSAITIYLKI